MMWANATHAGMKANELEEWGQYANPKDDRVDNSRVTRSDTLVPNHADGLLGKFGEVWDRAVEHGLSPAEHHPTLPCLRRARSARASTGARRSA